MLKQVLEVAPTYETSERTMMVDAHVWRDAGKGEIVLVESFAMTRAILVENIANQIQGLKDFDNMCLELASEANKVVPIPKRVKKKPPA